MFALPQAKRVRREELESRSRSTSPSRSSSDNEDAASNNEAFRAQLAQALGKSSTVAFDIPAEESTEHDVAENTSHDAETNEAAKDEGDAEIYAFNLFRPRVKTKSTTEDSAEPPIATKVNLKPPTPPPSLLHATYTPRPASHYTSYRKLSADEAAICMSGRAVLKQAAGGPRPGLVLPWRVVHLARSRLIRTAPSLASTASSDNQAVELAKRRRTRIGKKMRIKIREQHRAAERDAEKKREMAKAEEEKRREMAETERKKEEYLKEKKAKMNRKKQLKKREKQRAQKAGDGVGAGGE